MKKNAQSHRVSALGRVLPVALAFIATLLSLPAESAGVSVPDVPLFVSSASKPNVLVVLDNSNSMDESANGSAVGSNNASSKSEIARSVVKGLVNSYTGKMNLGLMAYQQTGVASYYLHNSPYDVSYNPANYDPAFSGARESLTKRFRQPNPVSAGEYIYFNVALPFYATSNQGNGFCYAPTAKAFNNGENPTTGPFDNYRCFASKKGISDAMPAFGNAAQEAANGYSSFLFATQFFPTDSDLAQGIVDFGKQNTYNYVSRTWFANSSPGRGYLHVPIKDLDSTQAAAIVAKLACNIPGAPAPCTNAGLQNAGLTPLEGTLLTAKDYFAGTLSKASEGYTATCYPMPTTTCTKKYVVLVTDGLPSNDKNGAIVTDPTVAIAATANAAAQLKSIGVETYVVGFALPYGTDPATLSTIAVAGGTGVAYSASDAASLDSALSAIFRDIETKNASGGAVTSSSTSINNTRAFKASFLPGKWTGELSAYPVTTSGIGIAPVWDASAQMPLAAARKLYTWSGSIGTTFPTTSQETALTVPVADYIKGIRTGEVKNGGTFRDRDHLLGDIIHSSPAYVKEVAAGALPATETVYVGANDGFLHAFDAATGTELFAYMPAGVNFANLKTLSSVSYAHKYFVDGPVVVSSRKQTPGVNILLGSLGRGGKGVFALDVTNPAGFGATNVKWESGADADMGMVLNKPIIVKLNNGDTGAIFGNGINSTNDRAVLYVYNLTTGVLLKKIDTQYGSATAANGLSGVRGWDDDGNGTVDFVYAGDVQGNLWKFDLSDKLTSKWSSAFVSGGKPAPLFVATDDLGNRQPITGGITLGLDPSTYKTWVFFGTGSYITLADASDKKVQSWYGLIDGAVIGGRASNLVRRSIVVGGEIAGRPVRGFETATAMDLSKRGWFVDLLTPPSGMAEGERMIGDPAVVGRTLIAASVIPGTDPCTAGGTGFINAIDAFTGTSLNSSFYDLDGDGDFTDETLTTGSATVPVGSVGLGVGMPTTPVLIDTVLSAGGSGGNTGSVLVRNPSYAGRISWHEFVNY